MDSFKEIEKQQKLRFAAVIEQLGIVYGKEIDDLLLRAYWAALKDVSIDDLENAAYAHIALEKWFPKPCELRGADETAISMRAWDTAIAAAGRIGAYKNVDFEDLVINATIRFLGGWTRFCEMKTDEEDWRRKEFLQAYRDFRRSGVSGSQCQPLRGIARTNTRTIAIAAPAINGRKHLLEVADRERPEQTRKALERIGVSNDAIQES